MRHSFCSSCLWQVLLPLSTGQLPCITSLIPFHVKTRPLPHTAAGGNMALILPFVLLVCTLAAKSWSMDPSLQTAIPVSTTLCDDQVTKRAAGALLHRNAICLQRAEAVLESVCGPPGCTAHGHPVSSYLIASSAATLTFWIRRSAVLLRQRARGPSVRRLASSAVLANLTALLRASSRSVLCTLSHARPPFSVGAVVRLFRALSA